jgi:predicted amidophosphoribosyltransferase
MGIAAEFIDLVLPVHCVACRAPGSDWCPQCRPASRLQWRYLPNRDGGDGGEAGDGGGDPGVGGGIGGVDPGIVVAAAAEYDGNLRTALLAFKERGRRGLSTVLGSYLGEAIAASLRQLAGAAGVRASPTLILPVPSLRPVARQRGGDHVRRLLASAAPGGVPVVRPGLLSWRAAVQDSAGLSAVERHRNVAGAMTARPTRGAGSLLLVDDIVTTGATLSEANRALTAAGWPVLGAAVIAATRRRDRAPARSGPRSHQ